MRTCLRTVPLWTHSTLGPPITKDTNVFTGCPEQTLSMERVSIKCWSTPFCLERSPTRDTTHYSGHFQHIYTTPVSTTRTSNRCVSIMLKTIVILIIILILILIIIISTYLLPKVLTSFYVACLSYT